MSEPYFFSPRERMPAKVDSMRALVTVLHNRVLTELRLDPTISKHFTIYGRGEVGAKAEELILKLPFILEAGLETNHRSVLALGFFEKFYKRSGVKSALRRGMNFESIQKFIMNGTFSYDELSTLREILARYEGQHVAVRSNAFGCDAIGTGAYKSFMCRNDLAEVELAVKKVLASYFTRNAAVVRSDFKIPEGILGMGIIIEPIVGDTYNFPNNRRGFGPLLGGCINGEGNLCVSYGFGIEAVQGRNYIEVKKDKSILSIRVLENWGQPREQELPPTLAYLLGFRGNEIFDKKSPEKAKTPWSPSENAIFFDPESGKLFKAHAPEASWDIKLNGLFEKLGKLNELCGRPQYVEFAVRPDKVSIQQIADLTYSIPRKSHVVPEKFEYLSDLKSYLETHVEQTILRAGQVANPQIIECSKIVEVDSIPAVGDLYEFNKTNKGYVVLYNSNLITLGRHLNIEHVSNAAAVLEIPQSAHTEPPIMHWKGRLGLRLFGVIATPRRFVETKLAPYLKQEKWFGSFRVYEANVRLIAPDNYQPLVMELLPAQK